MSYYCCLVTPSCPTLCNPTDCSPPGSSLHGISRPRILEWVAIPFSRGPYPPRDWTQVSCISRQILYPWATRKAQRCLVSSKRRFISSHPLSKKGNLERTDAWISYRVWCVHITLDALLGLGKSYRAMHHWPLLHLAPTLSDIIDSAAGPWDPPSRRSFPWKRTQRSQGWCSWGKFSALIDLCLDSSLVSSPGRVLWARHKFRSAFVWTEPPILEFWAGKEMNTSTKLGQVIPIFPRGNLFKLHQNQFPCH